MKFIKWKVVYKVVEDDGSHAKFAYCYRHFTEALDEIKAVKLALNIPAYFYPIFMTDEKYESLKEFEGV